MDSREALIALNMVEHVGPVRVRQLLEHFGEAAAILCTAKVVVDFLMLLMKRFAMADLVKAMFQRLHHQLLLRARVRFEKFFQQRSEAVDFGQRSQAGRCVFNVVEQVVENDVLRQQRFGDFHGTTD